MSNTTYPYEGSAREYVERFIAPGVKSVLDVGCGYGDFGAYLKRARPGIEVWGLDASPAVAERASERLDRFVLGTFPSDAPTRRFDCITFNDTIEHFPDPWDALYRARTLLEPGGEVVASIPNVRHYSVIRPLFFNGRWTYRDAGIMDRTHLRFFTRRSAIDLFEQAGYQVLGVAPVNVDSRGRAIQLLALLGPATIEFRATQYLFRAQPH